MMGDVNRRLFVGLKISTKLQRDLDNCAGGAGRYFNGDKPESLRIVTFGEDRIIGTFLRDGYPVSDIDDISRHVRSMVTLITPSHRIDEDAIRIYADSTIPISPTVRHEATKR